MNGTEIQEILKKIETELNGDPAHDSDVLHLWTDRYRNEPGAEGLLKELSRRISMLSEEDETDLTEAIFRNTAVTAEEDYEEALRLIRQGLYEKALSKLLPLAKVIEDYPLPEDTLWMDFASYLDSLVFQDLFSEEIGEQEVGRHPMHPGHILFTAGSLLIEMNRPKEALEILQQLYAFDPVCPKYIFELGEAMKRSGMLKEALGNAVWGLKCAANREDLARCYRDMGYCLSELEEYEDAAMLYQLSLRYQPSRNAENEIEWLRQTAGITPDPDEEAITARCKALGIPLELNETVVKNIEFLNTIFPQDNGEDE